jgi:hypothetical protein
MGKHDATEKCLYCQRLRGETGSRGLCATHVTMVSNAVRKGATTYEALEQAGKLLPRRNAGGKSHGAFQAWLKS